MPNRWSESEAKAKINEVIDLAQSKGPQTITRNGRAAVVVVAANEWQRRKPRKGNLAEFFAASPLRGFASQDQASHRSAAARRHVTYASPHIIGFW